MCLTLFRMLLTLGARERNAVALLPMEKEQSHSLAQDGKIRKLFVCLWIGTPPERELDALCLHPRGREGSPEPLQTGVKGCRKPSGGMPARRLTQDVPNESHHEHNNVASDQDPLVFFRMEVFPPQVTQEFLVVIIGGVEKGLLSFIQLQSRRPVETRRGVLQFGAGHHGLQSG